MSSFACFRLSFKASEILNIQISPAGHFLVKICFILVQLCEQKFVGEFNSFGRKNDAAALFYPYIVISNWTIFSVLYYYHKP